jgi:hypothetical protein
MVGGTVTTGGEPLTPVSGIEKSKIIIPKVDFD